MMVRLWLVLCLVASVSSAYAGEIYKWRDASGIVHFTDSLNKVPAKYRKEKPLIMEDRLSYVRKSERGSMRVPKSMGAKLWSSKCAACHYLGNEKSDGLKGLGYLSVNPVTKFPALVEDILPNLKYAVSGRTSGMKEVEISDAELRAVAQYIIDS